MPTARSKTESGDRRFGSLPSLRSTTVFLSLGSNLGDRREYLRQAVAELPNHGLQPRRISSLYETEPVGLPGGSLSQPWFLNGVVEGTTAFDPWALLHSLLALERAHGRQRSGIRPLPRTLDLDIILYGSERRQTPQLTLPHPCYRQRRFVLAGMAELAPERIDPEIGMSMAELEANCPDLGQVRKVEGPEWALLPGS